MKPVRAKVVIVAATAVEGGDVREGEAATGVVVVVAESATRLEPAVVPRAYDISICLIGSDQHKARPDLSDDSGFWLRVSAADALPFVAVFKTLPAAFHEFRIEQRVGKQIRCSTLSAQS
jgi:hypothetical protein